MNTFENERRALDAAAAAGARLDAARDDGVVILNGADVKPMPVRWLWPGWLALGKFEILAGAPGQGKTTIGLAIAATVTRGGRWPDGTHCSPGNVLIWSGEDDPADTLMPRLLAMGADPAKVHFITSTRMAGEIMSFDPARDLAELAQAAQRIGDVRYLLVDPVVSAVTGDSHKNTEVRRALQPLVDMATTLDCSVLGISHFSKGGDGRDPTERVVGSVAFGAVARVVLVAAKVKTDDGESRRVLARSKSNIGPDDGGFEYDIEQVELDAHPGVMASRIAWGLPLEGTARELLAEPDEQTNSESGARAAAEQFLRDVLAGGMTPTKVIEAEAREAGVAWRTVRRAADDLGVVKRKGAGDKAPWYWSLPNSSNSSNLSNLQERQVGGQVAPDTQLVQVLHPGKLDTLDTLDTLPEPVEIVEPTPADVTVTTPAPVVDDILVRARAMVEAVAGREGWPEHELGAWLADADAQPGVVLDTLADR